MSNYKFEGWAGLDADACQGKLSFQAFEPKTWDEDDVDVKVMYCGMCGSDASALSGEWGPVKDVAPQVCGHEIIGEVVRVGSQVENGLHVGSIVGIGAQSDSCRECGDCQAGNENFCAKQTITFNAPFNRGNGSGCKAHGGFAKYWRGPSKFAIPLPDGLDPSMAGPLFCGGVTVYAPLERFGAGKAAKDVGVIGIGGLGHFAVLFAAAMGANVTAISRSEAKKADATELGASRFIATGGDIAAAVKGSERSLDLIICTINPEELPVAEYLPLLKPNGTFVIVGVVPKPMIIPAFPLITGAVAIAGSNIGSPAQIRHMLHMVVEKDIKPWVTKWDMDDINKAMPAFKEGKPRYRFVLVNKDNGGQM